MNHYYSAASGRHRHDAYFLDSFVEALVGAQTHMKPGLAIVSFAALPLPTSSSVTEGGRSIIPYGMFVYSSPATDSTRDTAGVHSLKDGLTVHKHKTRFISPNKPANHAIARVASTRLLARVPAVQGAVPRPMAVVRLIGNKSTARQSSSVASLCKEKSKRESLAIRIGYIGYSRTMSDTTPIMRHNTASSEHELPIQLSATASSVIPHTSRPSPIIAKYTKCFLLSMGLIPLAEARTSGEVACRGRTGANEPLARKRGKKATTEPKSKVTSQDL